MLSYVLLKCLYSFTECTDAVDNGPDVVAVTESIEDKGSSPTATAETASTAAKGEDNVSSDIPKTAHRPPEKEIIPELPDATANAFTQLVRGKLHCMLLYSCISMQVATDLFKSFPGLGLTTVNILRAGNCIRFDPVTSFPGMAMMHVCTNYVGFY